MAKKATKYLPTVEIERMLAARYDAPAYAFILQVRNGTGSTRARTRTADALAFGLWPSRGLAVHGFEIKASRYDWQKELKNPEKAEDIGRFCHHWWMVTNDEVIQPGELPATWGHLVVRGDRLVCVKEAPHAKAKPLDVPMICAIMRRVQETMVPWTDVDRRIREEVEKRFGRAREATDYETRRMKESVQSFEERSGVKITDRWEMGEIAEAVKFIRHSGVLRAVERAQELRDCAKRIVNDIDVALPKLQGST